MGSWGVECWYDKQVLRARSLSVLPIFRWEDGALSVGGFGHSGSKFCFLTEAGITDVGEGMYFPLACYLPGCVHTQTGMYLCVHTPVYPHMCVSPCRGLAWPPFLPSLDPVPKDPAPSLAQALPHPTSTSSPGSGKGLPSGLRMFIYS